MLLCLTCGDCSLVDLQYGIFITKVDEFNIQVGGWTLLVTVDPPHVDPELTRQAAALINTLNAPQI